MLSNNHEVWGTDKNNFRKTGSVKLAASIKQQILEELRFRLVTQIKTIIFFHNEYSFTVTQKSSEYLRDINSAEFVLNHGVGLKQEVPAFKFTFKGRLKVDGFIPEVLEIINQEKMSVYCFGGGPGIAEKAAGNISKEFPGIIVSGMCNGFFFDREEVLADIAQVKPDLLLIGRGIPMQENWILQNFDELDATVMMAAGPYLDGASGVQIKMAELTRKIKMFWLSVTDIFRT